MLPPTPANACASELLELRGHTLTALLQLTSQSKLITALYSTQQLFGRCCTGKLEALGSEKARGRKAFPLKRAPISWVLLVPGRAGGCWYFAVFPGAYVLYRVGVPVTHRVAGTRSCRGVVHGVSSGRGHAIVPRGRIRSVLPARASLAHSDPLVSSSIAFCWALHRARRSWGRYIRPQEWTLGSKPRAVWARNLREPTCHSPSV